MQSCDRLYDTEIRKVTCATNAIESPNARSRCAVRARGHFPDEQSVLTRTSAQRLPPSVCREICPDRPT